MTTALDTRPIDDIPATMNAMGARARAAARAMGRVSAEARTDALRRIAAALKASSAAILEANAKDMEFGRGKGLSDAMMDRLALDEERIAGIAAGVEMVSELPDPVGRELARWTVPSGLDIARVSQPLGVIGVIYESRPNVTADAGALCIRAGNAVILRCGSESFHSSSTIVEIMQEALEGSELPADAVQLVPTRDRAAVGEMLQGLDGQIDVVVPRGGKGLVGRVQQEARVPVIGHLEGLCHIFLHESADAGMAVTVATDAKMRRTGVCGAMETLLVDRSAAERLLPPVAEALMAKGCELRGDEAARALVPGMLPVTEEDWRTEYLAPVLSVKLVDGVDGAEAHISRYGTGHTEAIIASDQAAADRFLAEIDASIVIHNASTQFADGGEFGMGAEIGIATGRIHARGPVGADQLTTFGYKVHGSGQARG